MPSVEAAVLAPVYRDATGRLRMVLILRAPRGVHGGQIALPGGRREPEDADLLATALRECEEEIGLTAADVEVLGALPIVDTVTTGFSIAPFLARVVRLPVEWRPQAEEVAGVLDVPLDEMRHDETEMFFDSWPAPRLMPFFWVDQHKLWGATYRIVRPLLPRLLDGEWPI